ncbi:MAG: acetylxylan esterase [Phycisphaera sp.]|nr:acetylxylan esterase [Phycisphaera sp.]
MRHARPAALFTLIAMTVATLVAAPAAQADPPRALPVGTLPDDARFGSLRTLDSYFPMKPVESKQDWPARAAEVRRRTRLATGLWPWPTRTPLNAVVYGKVEREGYTVERVFFEAVPGHFVTGSLYRPTGDRGVNKDGLRPAVLSPHGHWSNGRFYDAGEQGVRNQIAIGAERFEVGGRYPIQARCVQLARMGCIVFQYDMLSYADSIQFTEHRPGYRPDTCTADAWTFGSPAAEMHLQNVMGLQTWSSIRALDFVTSLDGVDTSRIAVTGASGGGTQTLLLTALDDRIDLSFPAVMTSTAMQGGCNCENAPYLRIDSGNIDLAALAAYPSDDHPLPRPLGMTSADDWTKELATKGLPELRALYKLLGSTDEVVAGTHTEFKHNYNAVNRVLMSNFVNKHFHLGMQEPVIEQDYVPLTKEELTVWTDEHPAPSGDMVGAPHKRAVTKWMTQDAATQLAAMTPTDDAKLAAFREVVGGAWDTIINMDIGDVKDAMHELKDKSKVTGYLQMTGLIHDDARKHAIPALWLYPKGNYNGKVVLWVSDTGKAGMLEADGQAPREPVMALLNAGYTVAGIDLFGQGEFTNDGKPVESQRFEHYGKGDQPWHNYAAYTYGYNPTLFAERVDDVLTALWMIQHHERTPKGIMLVGMGQQAGPIAAAALSRSGDTVERTAIDTQGFTFASVDRVDHPMFVPGALKYGGVDGLLALCAPHALWLAGTNDAAPPLTAAAYKTAGEDKLTMAKPGPDENIDAAAVRWLMQ